MAESSTEEKSASPSAQSNFDWKAIIDDLNACCGCAPRPSG